MLVFKEILPRHATFYRHLGMRWGGGGEGGGADFHHSCINMVQMSQHKQEFMRHLHNALYIHGWQSWLKTLQ